MTLSPFQILLLVLIGGFFAFAIIDRICKCIEHRITAISFAAFTQSMSDASEQDIKNAMEKFEKEFNKEKK